MPAITTPPDYRTSWACPWALVRWGGTAAGKRPGTRIAFIREAVGEDGTIIAFRAYTMKANGCWSKAVRRFRPREIVKDWRDRPSHRAVERARLSLKPAAA